LPTGKVMVYHSLPENKLANEGDLNSFLVIIMAWSVTASNIELLENGVQLIKPKPSVDGDLWESRNVSQGKRVFQGAV